MQLIVVLLLSSLASIIGASLVNLFSNNKDFVELEEFQQFTQAMKRGR